MASSTTEQTGIEGGDQPIPVTVVSGVLGAGKTTLVNQLLSTVEDTRIAVIVNDMGQINIDADLIERENEDTGIVDLSNGCICCRLQDDLITESLRLAEIREFDYLVVESSGISEPLPIARTFIEGTDKTEGPVEQFRLDTMVTVLDSYGFWKEFDSGASIPEPDTDPERPLAEVLIESIEFCDVLLLNKIDMVPDSEVDRIETAVRKLQPHARIERTTYGKIDPATILGTGRFDFKTARRSAGWKQQLRSHRKVAETNHRAGHKQTDDHDHPHTDAAATHGINSFVYTRTDPFDAERLAEVLHDRTDNVIRAKGLCYVAGTDDVIGMSRAGDAIQAGPIGSWGEQTPTTELVFIGTTMDEDAIADQLDAALADSGPPTDPDEIFPLRINP